MFKKITFILALVMLFNIVPCYADVDTSGISAKADELFELIKQCESKGLSVEYEKNNANIVKYYQGIIDNYDENGIDETILQYQINSIEKIYTDTKKKLENYIAERAESLSSAAPLGANWNINGKTLTGIGNTPGFSIGIVGASGLTKYADMGFDNFHAELEAEYFLESDKPVDCWKISDPTNLYMVKDGFNSETALKMKNEGTVHKDVFVEQVIPLLPGKTYSVSCWTQGTTTTGKVDIQLGTTFFHVNIGDTWTKSEFEYTAATDEYMTTVYVIARTNYDLCIDNISVKEKGTENELIINGDFEGDGSDIVDVRHEADRTGHLQQELYEAKQNNMGVMLLMHANTVGKYIATTYPDIVENTPNYNIYNLHDPKVQEVTEYYVRQVVRYIKSLPNLTSICLTNEPCYDTAYFPDTYNPMFQNYLKSIHNTDIETLNNRYGLKGNDRYSSWESITMPRDVESSPLFYDWMNFNNMTFANWHAEIEEIIREEVKGTSIEDIPIHTKMMNYLNYGDWREERNLVLRRGNDIELFDVFSDITGCDNSPVLGSQSSMQNTMKWYDMLNTLTDKPIYNSEDHITRDGHNVFSADYAKEFESYLWQSAIHGRDMSSIWCWSDTVRTEDTLYGHLALRPDCVAASVKSLLDQNRLAYQIRAIADRKADVAILYSDATRVYSNKYMGAMDTAYKGTQQAGRKVGFITERSINKLSEYNTLILPGITNAKQSTIDAIKSFQLCGGKVIILDERNVLAKNEYNQSNNVEDINSIKATATIVRATYNSLYPEMLSSPTPYVFAKYLIDENGIVVKDNDTGVLVDDVEWSTYKDNGDIFVNLFNYSSEPKTVYVTDGEEKILKFSNLTTEGIESETITIPGKSTVLLSVAGEVSETDEIASLIVTREGDVNTLSWETYEPNTANRYNIYYVLSDGSLKMINSTTKKNFSQTYTSAIPRVYVVKVVRKGGKLSAGKSITCGITQSVLKGSYTYINGNYNCTMIMTNNNSFPIAKTFSVKGKDDEGNTVFFNKSEQILPVGACSKLQYSFKAIDGLTVEFTEK